MSTPDTSAPVTPIELSLWDLDQIEVRREWQHIDIFLVDERNRLAVVIENKIDTGEHSDQLGRYYEVVKQHYPNCKVIGLYLTPAGDEKFTYLWVTGLSARFSTPWRRVRLRWPIPTYRFSLLITRRC